MKVEEKEAREKYDEICEVYHNSRNFGEGNFYNQMLEMPTTLKLLGKVKGKKILDFGCGTGIYANLLTKKGAIVKGFDISPNMIKIAKKENPRLDLRIGSGNKIHFKEKFDIVIAPLVVSYMKDWKRIFKQINTLLRDKGIFIFSLRNPVIDSLERIQEKKNMVFEVKAINYFEEKKIYHKWKKIEMPHYHKTYETLIKTVLESGFEIIGYKDAFPLKKSKKIFPDEYRVYSQIPLFCIWKVRRK